jgi:hypothetical protein
MASSIQLLRSNNPNERPFPGNLLDGQPAINTNAEEPGLFFKATDGSIVKIGPAAITSDGNPPNTGGTGSQETPLENCGLISPSRFPCSKSMMECSGLMLGAEVVEVPELSRFSAG